MWIFSTLGFFSITRSQQEPECFQVRSRERQDVENIMDLLGLLPGCIIETPRADYRWRVILSENQLDQLLLAFARELKYCNFKDAVKHTPGQRHKGIHLGVVWAEMWKLQQAERDREETAQAMPALFPDPATVLENPQSRKTPPRRGSLAKKATQMRKGGAI